MTSLLRELAPEPMTRSLSSTTTSRPERASARAIARPTTPAPITRHSTESMGRKPSSAEQSDEFSSASLFAVGAHAIQYLEFERLRSGSGNSRRRRPDELGPKLSY